MHAGSTVAFHRFNAGRRAAGLDDEMVLIRSCSCSRQVKSLRWPAGRTVGRIFGPNIRNFTAQRSASGTAQNASEDEGTPRAGATCRRPVSHSLSPLGSDQPVPPFPDSPGAGEQPGLTGQTHQEDSRGPQCEVITRAADDYEPECGPGMSEAWDP